MKPFAWTKRLAVLSIAALAAAGGDARAQDITVFETKDALVRGAKWRNIGPMNFSGRIVDIAVHPKNPHTWYIASASGGLWRTTTRGLRFEPIFESEKTTSIGDIAIDPSNPDILWVGTGEANNQRSSYWGDGVYKSVDGGKTWKNVGLRNSQHIGRIVVDPKDGNRVFVAALGNLYSSSEERGLYRTTDGGKTWDCVLRVQGEAAKDVGVVDVAMHPDNPRVLLAATYERRRRAWHFDGQGPGSGIWRSEDGGSTWARLEGGLPKGEIGRIGIAFSASQPDTVYAVVENENPRKSSGASNSTRRRRIEAAPEHGEQADEYEGEDSAEAPQGRRRAPRTVGGEIYRSDDAGRSWKKTNRQPAAGTPAYYYGQLRVDPKNPDKLWVMSVPLLVSTNGGKSFRRDGAPALHVDHHALWIDPSDTQHLLLGNDGGLSESFDAGKTWSHFENLAVAQFYAVGVDMAEPYRVYGGTQDNGSWGVPSAGPTSRGIRPEDVFKIAGGDGFYCCPDPSDPNIVYCESQFGALYRVDLRTMARKSIRPRPTRGQARFRFNWMSPIAISPHNPRTIWFGGNRLFRSFDRGDTWRTVSADLTTKDPEKLKGNVPHCTITTISESPVRPGYVWVGTDDGKLWMTPDGGQSWRDLTDKLPDEVQGLWVSRVEASHFDAGRCYVSITGYREDRFAPYLFVTDDYGLSFTSIAGDLPRDEPINVVREDPRNADLLFVGTELGAYASTQRGGRWLPLGEGMPRVAVHDLIVHPREPDVIVATHGRGFWIADVCALEHWGEAATAKGDAVLVAPRTVRRFPAGPELGYTRTPRRANIPNPPTGVDLCALLPRGAEEAALRVVDVSGRTLTSYKLPKDSGLHMVRWNLRSRGGASGGIAGVFGFGRGGRGGGRGRRGAGLSAGTYRVELEIDGKTITKPLVVAR